MLISKKSFRRFRIKKRIRKVITGTAQRPRMTVFRSNRDIYVQVIDDVKGHTIVSASSAEIETKKKVNKTEQAKSVGSLISEKTLKAGINKIVFDRNGYLFHGRIKALADSAREGGLKF